MRAFLESDGNVLSPDCGADYLNISPLPPHPSIHPSMSKFIKQNPAKIHFTLG